VAKRNDGFGKRNDGRWTRTVTIDGKKHYATDKSLSVAKVKYKALKARQKQAKIDKAKRQMALSPAGEVTVGEMAERYLTHCDAQIAVGELKPDSKRHQERACETIVGCFGRDKKIDTLNVSDFDSLSKCLGPELAPSTRAFYVGKLRRVFSWAMERDDLTTRNFRFGTLLKAPPKKVLSIHYVEQKKKAKGKHFTPEELGLIVDNATPDLRARVLLALNAAYIQIDLERVEWGTHINDRWAELPRLKNGMERRCYLWQETIDALNALPKLGSGQIFKPINRFSHKFRKYQIKLGVYARGRGFRCLRTTFRTVAGDFGYGLTTDKVMGHTTGAGEMAHVYTGAYSDQRLVDLSDHVHRWAFGN